MITRTAIRWHSEDWQRQLSDTLNSADELWAFLELPESALPAARDAEVLFPVRVPRSFAARMRKGDLTDPLLRQVVALGEECLPMPGFVKDPLQEAIANPQPGLLHKYASRVLVIAGSACAVHCRYCFRRHFPYSDNVFGSQQLDQLLRFLEQHPEVNEVIFSGGDPLVASNARIRQWYAALSDHTTVRRLRFHTRTPVVIPQRLDHDLVGLMAAAPLKTVVVFHSNHARELSDEMLGALAPLREAGTTLLNQSVLLRGVNDSVEVLADLSERLFEGGILPYYLHLLDPVEGAHHFHIADDEALRLYRQLADRLPGFLVPRLAREIPGAASKQWLGLPDPATLLPAT